MQGDPGARRDRRHATESLKWSYPMDPREEAKFAELYQRHQLALKLQGLRPKTVESYSRAVRRVAAYFDRSPDDLTPDELRLYFSDLVDSHSWSTVKIDRSGLQFFWRHVLRREWDWVDIVKPPRVKRLPDILSTGEVRSLIAGVEKLRYRTCLFGIYSMGLRLGEGIALRVEDIDSARRRVHVRDGKGRKDRYVPLPEATLRAFRAYWATHRNRKLLFPSASGTDHRVRTTTRAMDRGGVQNALKGALRDSGIHKRVSVHSLRHSYATHLVEAGVHLRLIQEFLGHATPATTAIYAHLSAPSNQNAHEILNRLMAPYLDGFRR
jgi:integrase/recombinase XerD